MAISQAIQADSSVYDKFIQDKTDSDIKDTQKDLKDTKNKVKELQDLIGQIQNPTAQQVAQQAQQTDILKGITTNTMSDYEKNHFGDIINTASPENLRNYRTLGMCAGDKESEQYLSNLYQRYSNAIQDINDTNSPNKYNPNVDNDPLRNKLQGVVNKQVVGVVKSSLSNIRKRVSQSLVQQKILEPWTDPNIPLTNEQKDILKKEHNGPKMGGMRKDFQTEKDSGHSIMHRILGKFKQSSEYGQLAEEYDKILTEFEQLTQSEKLFQDAVNEVVKSSKKGSIKTANDYKKSAESLISDKINIQQIIIDREQQRIDRLGPGGSQDYTKQPVNSKEAHNFKMWYDDAQEKKKNAQQRIKELNDLIPRINGDDLFKASHVRQQLFEPKFTDLNANLYHHRIMADQLSFQYEVKKDFASEYPILSKDNLDKLEVSDEDSLTNLSLYAGMFKPSLVKKTKNGESVKDILMKKYSERQAFLDAYGGVTQIQNAVEYSENNEIHCKISKADSVKAKEIINNIAKDWDRKNHGGMKYSVKGVYEITDLAVEEDFNNIKSKNSKFSKETSGGKNCKSDMFYHGTGSVATSLILGHSGQFKIVNAKVGRMLGNGIYLADKSSKSAQYISDDGFSRHGISGSLMVVEASLGDTISAVSTGKFSNNGYDWGSHDSVFGGKKEYNLLNNEWCVHDPKAVIPRYLVEMEIK